MLPSISSSKPTRRALTGNPPCGKETSKNSPGVSEQQATAKDGTTKQGFAAAGPGSTALNRSEPRHSRSNPTELCHRPSSSRISSSTSNTISPGTRAGLSPSSPNSFVDRQLDSRHILSRSSNNVPPSSTADKTRPDLGNRFAVGIEVEMVMGKRDMPRHSFSGMNLRQDVVINHNLKVDKRYPRMRTRAIDEKRGRDDFEAWTLSEEASVDQRELLEGRLFDWGVELRSPKLRTDQEPDWKSTVKTTWAFIERRYQLSKNEACSTHVHISMIRGAPAGPAHQTGMGLEHMKMIAQCVIHFEPALEVLISKDRRGNRFAMSNWIDNSNFAMEYVTRESAMRQINQCSTEDELIKLMCPQPHERYYAFNFHAMKKFGTIEFRKGSASLNSNEVIAWADLVLLFFQAAVQCKPESLIMKPANIRTLKEFLGSDKLGDIQSLFHGKQSHESLQPELFYSYCAGPRNDMLKRKLQQDKKRQERLNTLQ